MRHQARCRRCGFTSSLDDLHQFGWQIGKNPGHTPLPELLRALRIVDGVDQAGDAALSQIGYQVEVEVLVVEVPRPGGEGFDFGINGDRDPAVDRCQLPVAAKFAQRLQYTVVEGRDQDPGQARGRF